MLAALVVPASAVAQEVQQYDIVCTGTKSEKARPSATAVQTPFETRIAVDLATRSWCEAVCEVPKQMFGSNAELIQFHFAERDFGGGMLRALNSIQLNRTSGRLSWIEGFVSPSDGTLTRGWEVTANCQRAEFTPFPVTRF